MRVKLWGSQFGVVNQTRPEKKADYGGDILSRIEANL